VAPFIAALNAPGLARPVPARFDLAPVLAGLALLLLVLRHLPALWPSFLLSLWLRLRPHPPS
jgi:hypothetical protein